MISKCFCRRLPAEGLSWPTVKGGSDRLKFVMGVPGEVSALGKVLAQETIGVLIGTPLPRAVRVAEVDWQSCFDSELDVLSHLGTLVPCQRPAQLLRQRD